MSRPLDAIAALDDAPPLGRWTRTDTAIALALAAAAFAYFWPLFAPGTLRRWFVDGDFIDQFFAFTRFEASELAHGRLPLWNPYAFSGGPFWADIQAAVAYPPSLAVVGASLALTGGVGVAVLQFEAVAHIALAAVFTYAFGRRVIGARGGAALAGVAFAFGGYLTGYPPLQLAVLESNAWLPLALWAVEGVIRGEGSTRGATYGPRRGSVSRIMAPDVALLAVALALPILAGHPQSTLYLAYTCLAYALWRTWPWRATPRRIWWALAVAAAAALGLSAAGWLPAAAFLRLSNRADASYAMLSHGFPPRELLGLAVPGLTRWSPLYVGALPLLLALSAAWRWFCPTETAGSDPAHASAIPNPLTPVNAGPDDATPRPRPTNLPLPQTWARGSGGEGLLKHPTPFWLALAAAALALSLGARSVAFDAAYHLAPGFDLFRGQERAAFLVSFALAMLAGIGLAAWQRGDGGRSVRWTTTRVLIAGASALLIPALVAPSAGPGAAALKLRLALVALGAGGVAWAAGGRWPRARRLRGKALAFAVIALTWVDLHAVGARADLADHPAAELAPTPLTVALRDAAGLGRVHDDDRLPRNFGVLDGIESTNGASPLVLEHYRRLREGLLPDHEARFWQLTATTAVVTWRDRIDGAEPVLTVGEGDAATTVHALDEPSPYAWRAFNAVAVADDDDALKLLRDPAFDPFGTVLVHDGAPGGGPFGSQGATGVDARGPGGRVDAHTDGGTQGWLVFSEVWHPGWRATVDGAPAPIVRADVALMAVAVPAGEHVVGLRFTDRWVSWGIAISLATSLLLLVSLVVRWRK